MCGADPRCSAKASFDVGSSPRVRSRRREHRRLRCPDGIISACAEQTMAVLCTTACCRDHLRVCGADRTMSTVPLSLAGSSPRVRSRLAPGRPNTAGGRIISACAEQTDLVIVRHLPDWDHLRVCGADSIGGDLGQSVHGSSPRVRSRPF